MTSKTALTIGTFDGVHIGHISLIKKLSEKAKRYGLQTKVVFFPIPPKFYISGKFEGNLITTLQERKKLLLKAGADLVEELIFDEKIKNMSADDFFQKFILDRHKAAVLVVGRDFAIGKDRSGNISFLSEKCLKSGIEFFHANTVKLGGYKISSTLIRNFIKSGKMELAARCLARPYSIVARVIKGAGIGRKIGFPTANLSNDSHKILPEGIFAGKALYGGYLHNCVISVGRRPTFKTMDMALLAEAHILDFTRDIYGEEIEIFFFSKLREEMKFSGTDELVKQIRLDIKTAREILKTKIVSV